MVGLLGSILIGPFYDYYKKLIESTDIKYLESELKYVLFF